jgi:putative Mg2+ transporter-C (MgtC) family protein
MRSAVMPAIDDDWLTITLRLGVATFVGMILGFEREWRGHDAGLRTHALVALSAATITVSALLIAETLQAHGSKSDPLRVIQGLAQAIGFIAGGLIFIRGGDVRNMTTAANLWLAAAAGIVAGAGQFRLVAMAAVIGLLILTLASLLERWMPRRNDEDDDGETRMPNRRGATRESRGG